MLSNTLLGCIIFLITNISLLYTSHLIVRKFLSNAPHSVRLVAIGTLFYSFIILIFQILSPFHAITKAWVTISCLLLSLISHFIWGTQRNIQADIEPIRSWIRDGLNSKWAVLLIICGFVVLLSLSRALLMPPLAWDCLTYHLTFAALWIKKGTLLSFMAPDQMQGCAHFPINGEIFASWLLLPFQNDLLVNTVNFPITLLGGIACYAIARELGLTRKEASFAPALICFAPMIYSQITTSFLDNAVFAFCAISVLFTLRYLHKGYLYDSLLSLVSAGILFGMKYTSIPAVGLIFLANSIKTITLVRYTGFLKKLTLIFLSILILCMCGGRKYIYNTIEAGNPFYPFPFKISHYKILEGWPKMDEFAEWVIEIDKKQGFDKFRWWDREYRKFLYHPLTAGPKFLLFLILALISLFSKPRNISKKVWYFLSIMWIVPIWIYYSDTSANVARMAYWVDLSTRYISPFFAFFIIQGLIFIKKLSKDFKNIDLFLVILVFWDVLHIKKTHAWDVAILYPAVVLIIPFVIILFKYTHKKLKSPSIKNEVFSSPAKLPKFNSIITRKLVIYYLICFIFPIGILFLFQSYRDSSRYTYYREHSELTNLPRKFVNGWEFLDQPDEKKTIAMAMGWSPPTHNNWFFYPLLGRWLQNDIVYVSAKYKWKVPTWLHRGMLRGNDFSIWLYNLKKKKVDYILVQTPWPIELRWMQRYQDKFQLVFSDKECKIFMYIGEAT